jgi:hypothetical protein
MDILDQVSPTPAASAQLLAHIDSVPVMGFSCIVLLFAFPKQLSREPVANRAAETVPQRLKRFDALGGILLLGITVPLTTALQQAAQGGVLQ